jgi:uncharacterized protein YdiU (UPF0061 family)
LLDSDNEKAIAIASEVLGDYPALFERYWLAGMRKKLGIQTEEAGDVELIQTLLDWTRKAQADFTNTFRDLSSQAPPAGEGYRSPDFQDWYSRWRLRLSREDQRKTSACVMMRAVNPAVIPRNHRVEEALSAAEDHDDLSVLHRLLAALASPYQAAAASAPYQEPPPDDSNYRTFCGT